MQTMVRKTRLETILYPQNRLSGLYQALIHQTRWKKNLCMPENKSEVWCCMASHMEWHRQVQEEGDWLRLLLFENEVGNITKTATWMHLTYLVLSIPCQQTQAAHSLDTDCLAASNGICTKRNTAQFGLVLFENKVNNNSQTWPLIQLTSLATFYSKTTSEVNYACERIIINIDIVNMKMANFSFGWNTHTASFYLILTRGPYSHCKEELQGDFKLKDAF